MTSTLFGALIALCGGLVWGGGDFTGGLASRRAKSAHVLIIGGTVGFAALILLALLWREPMPPASSVGWSLVAGLCGMIGLASLYHGLANGRASVVSPTSTLVSITIPVLYSALREGVPTLIKLLGFVLACAGVWMASRQLDDPNAAARESGFRVALLAGLGFGLFFILISWTDVRSVFGSLAAARVATVGSSLAILFLRREAFSRAAFSPISLASGVLDAIGNALFLIAKQYTRLDVATVLGSMYPISTILLSFALLKEKIAPIQWLGIGLCLVAISLIV
jgi:drug/metabolite transporter (DMT)-like permease